MKSFRISCQESARLITARLDRRLPLGTRIVLYIFLRPVQPFELAGDVVRHTENGFALALEEPSLEVRHLIDDVAALVTVTAA